MSTGRKTMAANYWNHNSAYYPWVLKGTRGCRRILDVDCGNGELAYMLAAAGHSVVGLDPTDECISKARVRKNSEQVLFACASFESFEAQEPFDAIAFVASIRHMDMAKALTKAKGLLAPGGVIAVVGLASGRWLSERKEPQPADTTTSRTLWTRKTA